MRIALSDAHKFEREPFVEANRRHGFTLEFLDARLSEETAGLAAGFDVVCPFVNDRMNRNVLERLRKFGIRLLALRSAGFNHVDLCAAEELGLTVVRVPEYSPYAVAEHAVALILALDRKICRANARTREGNFSLDGLVGFDLHGKTVGVVGTGRIGSVFARIMTGFGCRVLGFDRIRNPALETLEGFSYAERPEVLESSDILSLHVPLTPDTRHLIDAGAFAAMKKGAMLVNTGRGALVDAKALIDSLKKNHLGYAGLDVYEEEEGIFFEDLSDRVLEDDVLARLLTFPNVLITSHQAFLTREALTKIAETTLRNVADFEAGHFLENRVVAERVLPANSPCASP